MTSTAAPLSPLGVGDIDQLHHHHHREKNGYSSSGNEDDFVLVEDECDFDNHDEEEFMMKDLKNDTTTAGPEEETAPKYDEKLYLTDSTNTVVGPQQQQQQHQQRTLSARVNDFQRALNNLEECYKESEMEKFRRAAELANSAGKKDVSKEKMEEEEEEVGEDDSVLVENIDPTRKQPVLALKKKKKKLYTREDVIVSVEVVLDSSLLHGNNKKQQDVDIAEEAKEFVLKDLLKTFPSSIKDITTNNSNNKNDNNNAQNDNYLTLQVSINLATPENTDARKWNAGLCNLSWLPMPEIRSARLGAVVSLYSSSTTTTTTNKTTTKKQTFIGKQQFIKNGKHLHGMNDIKEDSDPDAVKKMAEELSDSICKTVLMVLKRQGDWGC